MRKSAGERIEILALRVLDHVVPLKLPSLFRREVLLCQGLRQFHPVNLVIIAQFVSHSELRR